ncbi:hypothetical protein [Pedobacter metabolipauper]|uniref:Uncharacterized protein n=1 Tax=Pedobacter metabolipauper TaxID=425513 RepID=A0A4R6SQ42_9SPHI|nr:hypothetical protein [Pedobacter metabolipauper]TDQ06217.1 hypothetical protein ATK78_4598 [Pedobacter metabolipauper]
MTKIQQDPVLGYIVDLIKDAIADAKVEQKSETVAIIKDGNDSIQIEQTTEGSNISIHITDKKEILYSEDLLEPLQDIHESVKSDAKLKAALQKATIIVNGLSIETEFIFQAVKDSFDTLSTSYEFVKIIEKRTNGLTVAFKFGDHKFQLDVINNPEAVKVTAEFGSSLDAKISKTIGTDVAKVESALNKLFKDSDL